MSFNMKKKCDYIYKSMYKLCKNYHINALIIYKI